jgi:magnesium chelatase family protein
MQIMSLAIVHTRARFGTAAPIVTVEVHLSNGLPCLSIVGLPETAVKESKDRVRSALINSQFEFPARRITINLAPADLPKNGGRFDLAIAIGILAASGQIPESILDDIEFIGELALTGELRGVNGVLPAAIACGESGRSLIVAKDNADEVGLCIQTKSYGAANLLEVCAHLTAKNKLSVIKFNPPKGLKNTPDFEDVHGQFHAKRALEVAAAGGHNILLYGPPGTGKTMLASRLPSIMPPLLQSQSLEVTSIHSLCGYKYQHWQVPPFRNPHHTASSVALVGGGSHPKPGEISLAHHGVLFLDELPEFQRQVLEVLREPLESGVIQISRATAQLSFPARFQLVAAMNPCPCGYLTSRSTNAQQRCTCTREQIQRYRKKISGPLLDRIDLHVPVNSLSIDELNLGTKKHNENEPSLAIRERVIAARTIQYKRQQCNNADLSVKQLEHYCPLGEAERELIGRAIETMGLSARAYHRIVKVAQTIADLSASPSIEHAHIGEALGLRNFDR